MNAMPPCCTVCQCEKPNGEVWFLLTENHWKDRIKILQCNEELADLEETYRACSPAHVEQLVAHWMATGTLNYPFSHSAATKKAASARGSAPKTMAPIAPDLTSATLLGELAVHRESLNRALLESPESLVSILDALTTALPKGQFCEPSIAETRAEDESQAFCSH